MEWNCCSVLYLRKDGEKLKKFKTVIIILIYAIAMIIGLAIQSALAVLVLGVFGIEKEGLFGIIYLIMIILSIIGAALAWISTKK